MKHQLNYQHLFYFWTVAREGTITKACQKLGLAQPTISGQLSAFEKSLGGPLFRRSGRKLILSEKGRDTYELAEKIFSISHDLEKVIGNIDSINQNKYVIGIDYSVSDMAAARILKPIIQNKNKIWISIIKDNTSKLETMMRSCEIEFIISGRQIMAEKLGGHCHQLGAVSISAFANNQMLKTFGNNLECSVENIPVILPTKKQPIRNILDEEFKRLEISFQIVAELDDASICYNLAADGLGIIFAPKILKEEMESGYGLFSLGVIGNVTQTYYVIARSETIKSDRVKDLIDAAKLWLQSQET